MNEDQIPLTPDEAREIITLLGEYERAHLELVDAVNHGYAGDHEVEGANIAERYLFEWLRDNGPKLEQTLTITLNWYMPFSEDTYRE